MSRKIHDDLINLANKHSPRIICGLLAGRMESGVVVVEKFYAIPTRWGPKIHFKPDWNAYRFYKKWMRDRGESFIGEFHTHPDGTEELNINDQKILRKLRRGFWIIVTPEKVVPWYYKGITGPKSILEKPNLEIASE